MNDAETQRRIKANLAAVRDYLKKHFPDYAIIETSGPSLYHKFVVTNDTLHKRHRLRVELARLSNRRNTPEHTRLALESGNVAGGMIQVGDNDYYW